jgi:hypothetical protein
MALTYISDNIAALCCRPACRLTTSAGMLTSAHPHQTQTGQFHPVAAQPPAPAPAPPSTQARGAAAAALAAMMTGVPTGQPHHAPSPAPPPATTRRALEGMTTEGGVWGQCGARGCVVEGVVGVLAAGYRFGVVTGLGCGRSPANMSSRGRSHIPGCLSPGG